MSIKDYFFYHKKKFITVVLFVVILVGDFFLYKVYAKELNYSKEIEKKTEKTVLKTDKKEENKEEKKQEDYVVDIKGEVINPGIYSASKNDRVIDIIKKAGGLTRKADTYYLNLSQKVTDQMLIRVSSKYEVNLTRELELKEKERKLEVKNKKEDSKEIKKVSINTASKEELINVAYITENIANLIIERRNKSLFKNIEELLEIKGIKENTLAKIKENITL